MAGLSTESGAIRDPLLRAPARHPEFQRLVHELLRSQWPAQGPLYANAGAARLSPRGRRRDVIAIYLDFAFFEPIVADKLPQRGRNGPSRLIRPDWMRTGLPEITVGSPGLRTYWEIYFATGRAKRKFAK
jgi:hypothetical protein